MANKQTKIFSHKNQNYKTEITITYFNIVVSKMNRLNGGVKMAEE